MTITIVLNIFKQQQVEQEYQAEVIEKTFLYELTEKEEILNNVYYTPIKIKRLHESMIHEAL